MFAMIKLIGKKKFINKAKHPRKKHPKIISRLKEGHFILNDLQKIFP